MILESPPVYGAAGSKGLKASYILNFSADVNHIIGLSGSWQGDPVEAKTLSIDNTANSYSLRVNVRGSSFSVAPYTLQYVDCRGGTDVAFTATNPTQVVSVDVLNYVIAESATPFKVANVGGLAPIVYTTTASVNSAAYTHALVKGTVNVHSYVTLSWPFDSQMGYSFDGATFRGPFTNSQMQVQYDNSMSDLWLYSFGGTFLVYIDGA